MGNSVMLNGVEYAGEQIAYKDSTYELVSKVAYLIGVPLRIFQNEQGLSVNRVISRCPRHLLLCCPRQRPVRPTPHPRFPIPRNLPRHNHNRPDCHCL